MAASSNLPKRSPGRPKGSRNKVRGALRGDLTDWCRRVVNDRRYRQQLKERLIEGKIAPAVESLIWHYAIGKPTEKVELEVEARRVVNIIPFTKPEPRAYIDVTPDVSTAYSESTG